MAGGNRGWSRGFAAAALAVGLAVTGCGGTEGGTQEIRYAWWGNAERAKMMKEAIRIFEKENPDVTVTPTFSEFNTYWEKLSTQVAGGGMPDVLQMDNAYLRQYGDRGVLLDLDAQAGENLDTSGLVPNLEQAGVVDGKRYAVPVGGNTFALFYAPKLFEEAGAPLPEDGWTWAEYHDALTKVSEHTNRDPYGAADYTGLIWVLEAQLRQEGEQLFTEDGQLGFTRGRLAEFWAQTADLRADDQVVPASKAAQAQPVSPIGANLAASEFSWDNFHARFAEEADLDLELAPLPTDTERSGQYLKPSLMLSASAQTSHPEEAAKLVDFMVNDPRVAEIFGGSRGIPATEAQREAAEYDEVGQEIADYEEARTDQLQELPPPPPAGAGALETEFIRLSEEVQYDRMSPEEAAEEFFSFAEQELAT